MRLSLSDLEHLKHGLIEARASGVRSVRDQNGEEITYKSDRELAAALADIEARIRNFNRPVHTIMLATSKGL